MIKQTTKSTYFDKEYAKLNAAQKEAVDEIEGPVMVLAGPGTGKTQIMALRIANILKQTQINPTNILALTFTESGVFAIKDRLLQIIGPAGYQVHIHTFHSFCNEVILTFPEKFLFAKKLNQLTDLEQILLLQQIIKNTKLTLLKPFKSPFHYQAAVIDSINKLKQEGIDPAYFAKIVKKQLADLTQNPDCYHQKGRFRGKMKSQCLSLKIQLEKNGELSKVYQKYQAKLQEAGQYDYADMILLVLTAFRQDSELLSFYQEKFQYILVDEYQDTNSAQNEIIRILASFYDNPNVFVVGDDEQSIFRFQGAALENILYFQKLYPTAKTVILKHNYRSGQKILDSARAVIINNQNQILNRLKIEKRLQSQIKDRGRIYLGRFAHFQTENFFIAQEIKKLHRQGTAYGQIAVLYRQHRDAEQLVDFLAKLKIPYQMAGGGNVLDAMEIKKILRFLKVLDTAPDAPDADLELFEILHYPFFKIPTLDIYRVSRFARQNKLPLLAIVHSQTHLKNAGVGRLKNWQNFSRLLLSCQTFSHNHTFAQTFEYIINETGYLTYLLGLADSVFHLNRLDSLFSQIKILNGKNKNLTLRNFLEYLNLMEENNLAIKEKVLETEFDGVHLMTAHKAKGLEFDTVFIMRLIDKHWGSRQHRQLIKLPTGLLQIENTPAEEDEEERRLFYVGLTRAQKRIYLTLSTADDEEETIFLPSKFLEELPEKLIKNIHTAKYEKQFDRRLALTFGPQLWQPALKMSDFLRRILRDFALSSTALNTYLKCPQKFLYDNLLRAPKVKTVAQSYGTAVHKALEMFFRHQIKILKIPSADRLLAFFDEALKEEILSAEDFEASCRKGRQTLRAYFNFYQTSWQKSGPAAGVEYNFSAHNVHFGQIPITGKIDKIELVDKIGGKVRIVDYKTAKPKSLNYILGQTKEKDLSLFYQAYFYKLLADTDPLFTWQASEIEFDFIEPQNGRFVRVKVPIEKSRYETFKKSVEKTYAEILKLNFPKEKKACRGWEKCAYFDTCNLAD